MAETSDKVSSIAARYAGLSNTALKQMVQTREGLNEVAHDVRTLAASCLRQDETRGLRGLIRKVLGQ
jgi:hypothetical protein